MNGNNSAVRSDGDSRGMLQSSKCSGFPIGENDELLSELEADDIDELEIGTDSNRFPSELVETPLDPETLVLNPGGETTDKNPLCPHCEEEITPVSNDFERRFVCGCETNWEFRFGE